MSSIILTLQHLKALELIDFMVNMIFKQTE
jgi:hypothetical protein